MPANPQSFADQVFSAVVPQLMQMYPGDETGRMLRAPGLKTSGKFYAFATAEDLVVKLPRSRVQELIDSGVGQPCSPQPGRPMKEWVCIPAPVEESCLSYLQESRTFVSSIAARST